MALAPPGTSPPTDGTRGAMPAPERCHTPPLRPCPAGPPATGWCAALAAAGAGLHATGARRVDGEEALRLRVVGSGCRVEGKGFMMQG